MSRYAELLRKCPLRPIKSEKQLDRAITMIEGLIDQRKRTKTENDYVEVLSLLVHEYEGIYYPIEEIHGVPWLACLIEAKGVTQKDVANATGMSPGTLSEILKGKRSLTLKNINKLAPYFKVSPASFLSCS